MLVARTLLTALFVMPSVCFGQVQPTRLEGSVFAAQPVRIASDFEAMEQVTEAKLQQVAEDMRFEEAPLADVINHIQAQTGLKVIIDRSAAEYGLRQEHPITFSAAGISWDKVLELLLADHEADFVIDHGIVRIIANDVRNEPAYRMTRVYDCANLLERLPELSELTLANDGSKGKTTGLRQLVMEMVTPNDWNSGSASLRQVEGLLVVSHDRRGHRSLQELLSRLQSKLQAVPNIE